MDIDELVTQQKIRLVLEPKATAATPESRFTNSNSDNLQACQSAIFYNDTKTVIYVGNDPITIEGTIISTDQMEGNVIRVELSDVMCSSADGSKMSFRYRQPVEGGRSYREHVRKEDFMEATATFTAHLADRRQRETTASPSTRVGVPQKSPKYFSRADVYINR